MGEMSLQRLDLTENCGHPPFLPPPGLSKIYVYDIYLKCVCVEIFSQLLPGFCTHVVKKVSCFLTIRLQFNQ